MMMDCGICLNLTQDVQTEGLLCKQPSLLTQRNNIKIQTFFLAYMA